MFARSPTKRLRVTEDAGDRPVWRPEGRFPVLCGAIPLAPSWTCGSCDGVLLEAVPDRRLWNLVLVCPACGALNETRTGTPRRTGVSRTVAIAPREYLLHRPLALEPGTCYVAGCPTGDPSPPRGDSLLYRVEGT